MRGAETRAQNSVTRPLCETNTAQYFFTYEVAKRTQSELIGRDKMGYGTWYLIESAALNITLS